MQMLRLERFALVAVLLLLVLPKSAHAQTYFGGNSTFYTYTTVSIPGGTLYVPQAPRPTHDSRMDPRLLKAARIADAHAFPHSRLRCWQYVKNALLEAGAVGRYPATNYAYEAGSELTCHHGFVRLPIHNPYRAPVGAVLVYRGGNAGHVEIRTERGFASDYHSAWACRYRLIGVYAKFSA